MYPTAPLMLAGMLLSSVIAFSQSVPASDANKHLGEKATVCGRIAETHTASGARGVPTFIDFDNSYPNQTFMAVIWQQNKASVGVLPTVGMLCVTGTIIEYRGRPEIVLHSRSDWETPQTRLSNNNHYTNVDGQSVHSPAYSPGGIPPGATAQCADGTYSFSAHRQGTCSHHGGVAKWL